jgi:hypothetical protein
MKHSTSTPKHAEAAKPERELEKDLSAILRRSDEKVKDIFQRHESSRGRASDSQQEDQDPPDPKQSP